MKRDTWDLFPEFFRTLFLVAFTTEIVLRVCLLRVGPGGYGKGLEVETVFKHWWDIGKKGIPKPSWSYTMDHHGPTIYQLYSLYLIYILLILFRFTQSTCCGVAISLRSYQMSENGMRTNVWDCMLRAQAVSFYAAMQCHSCPTQVAGRNRETQDRKIKSSKLQNGDMPTWMLPRTYYDFKKIIFDKHRISIRSMSLFPPQQLPQQNTTTTFPRNLRFASDSHPSNLERWNSARHPLTSLTSLLYWQL